MIFTIRRNAVLALLVVAFGATACGSTEDQSAEDQSTEATEASAEQTQSTYSNIDVDRFDELVGGQNYVALDVRTPDEVAEGKIGEAMELDFYNDNFENELKKLDKSKHYLVYCKSGGRSSNTAEMMIKEGFKHVYNLEGGYTAWAEKHNDNNLE